MSSLQWWVLFTCQHFSWNNVSAFKAENANFECAWDFHMILWKNFLSTRENLMFLGFGCSLLPRENRRRNLVLRAAQEGEWLLIAYLFFNLLQLAFLHSHFTVWYVIECTRNRMVSNKHDEITTFRQHSFLQIQFTHTSQQRKESTQNGWEGEQGKECKKSNWFSSSFDTNRLNVASFDCFSCLFVWMREKKKNEIP